MLSPGDLMPFCYGMDGDRRFYSFEEQAGRPAVLVLAWRVPGEELSGLVGAFARCGE